jgi:hypothetical protein
MERSPDSVLWDFLRGALTTRALGVVADLGVADALAGGARDIAGLADELGVSRDALQRLLRALASEGVFEEIRPGVFANTEVSELLCDPSRRAFAHLFGGVYLHAVGHLDASREPPPFTRAFGTDLWSWLAAHPDERAAFDLAMANGIPARAELLRSVEWRGDEVVVDVGGGDGSLLRELLRDRPNMRGVVLDLPEAVPAATPGDRIEYVAGSFFDAVPPGDAYVLAAVLHDWDDEQAAAIVRAVHRSAGPRARLVIIDGVLEPGSGSAWRWADLHMLATLGGRERDESEWRRLLAAGGFEPLRVQDGLIEAVPVSPTG